MTGLEKIISQIEYDSNDRCKSIIAQAEEKAESIIKEAEAEAETIKAEAKAQLDKKLDNMKQSAVSSAELSKSKTILSAKLTAIDGMLEKSLAAIKALPEEEYFEILKTLAVNNAKSGEGVLCFSQKDKDRLPKDFIRSVNAELTDGSVVLGDSIDIDSGFILVYGDIDINCSFDAIAASKRDELRDALNALLFE